MDTTSTPYRVHQCSKCPGDTEHCCDSCPCDLCPKCKENHVKDLKTIDHNVVAYRNKFKYISTQENCVRHPSNIHSKYCELCELPLCYYCKNNSHHNTLGIRTAYQKKRQQHREIIHKIKIESLLYTPFLLTGIKGDFKTCCTELSLYQSEILLKARRLKDLITYVLNDLMANLFCDFDIKHRCLKQKIEIIRHLASLQIYEHRYEQPGISTLLFLSFLKKTRLPKINPTLHTSQLSITELINKKDVIDSLSEIKITEGRKRAVKYNRLLKLVSPPEFHQSITVSGVNCCHHISCVSSKLVWVSYKNNLKLTKTAGDTQCPVEDLCSNSYCGSHTVNGEGELIYINSNFNINKLSKDLQTTTTCLEIPDFALVPRCVYWSPSTGDLLVGMYSVKPRKGKISRFNQAQNTRYDFRDLERLREPRYITENNNGDVVVSDYRAIVVTEGEGKYRFAYMGHPSGPGIWPCGICTDALSHILICDGKTLTVQVLEKNGQFLTHLLIRPSGIFKPRNLYYDASTHRLWVSSGDRNKVCVYRYLSLQDDQKNLNTENTNVLKSLHEFQINETIKQPEENVSLFKLVFTPADLHQHFIVTGVYSCDHISCFETSCVWVSDRENNLILTNTTGVPLQRVEDFCKSDKFTRYGSHTINSESELFYIDRSFNINKLSVDTMTTTIFLNTTDPTCTPQCVYWSSSTGDLMVGMYREDIKTGKVTRYNQSGQLTQTIEHDSNGLDIYRQPSYITENNNGNIVVSDYRAVVVTELGGKYRFSYTGHPAGSGIWPYGICTDPLSHILVCEGRTKKVQILDKDGNFLSCLLTPSGVFTPRSLSYDFNKHLLWVGSSNINEVCVYNHKTHSDFETGMIDTNCVNFIYNCSSS